MVIIAYNVLEYFITTGVYQEILTTSFFRNKEILKLPNSFFLRTS